MVKHHLGVRRNMSADEYASKINFDKLLAFIAPCLPFAALGFPLSVTLPDYYINEIGLSLASVGFVFMVVKIIDLLVDPVLGFWMDRTQTRYGRFKVWISLCLPVLLLGTGFIFLAPKGANVYYLGLWLLVIYIGFSMAALSQAGWASVLTDDYNERNRIFSAWQVANILGIFIIIFVPILVMNILGGTLRQSVEAMGYTIMVMLPITIGLALWRVHEPKSMANSHDIKLSDYFAMFKFANVRRLLWADLWLGLAPGIMGVLFFFYFIQFKGLTRQDCNIALASYFLGGMIGAPIWVLLSKAFDKHKTLIIASIIFVFIYALMAFVPPKSPLLSAAIIFAAGMPYAASLLLTRSMMADIGDQIILESGQDHKGTLMAILSATTKLGYALSVAILAALDYVGFDNKATQNSPESLQWLQAFFIGLPIVFLLCGAWSLRKYDLTSNVHKTIINKLKSNA